ncbi:MAG: nitroreductase family protein [Acidimicrobiia bacterium]|nr:nitroreductase family protein [Acidimicrobiia bacterium]
MDLDLATVDHLLSTTRSVRKRLDLSRDVGPEVIEDCLRLAVQAPTGGNSQGWRWIVVTDPDRRAALADLYRRNAEPYFAASEAARGVDDTGSRILDSARYLAAHLQEVPVHVVPCCYGRGMSDANIAAAGLYGSIYPAVWSFQLALRSRGLGSVLTTLHLACEREAAELLGIPEGVVQVGLLPVAYYTGKDFKPASRRPAEEVTYWDAWKRPRE